MLLEKNCLLYKCPVNTLVLVSKAWLGNSQEISGRWSTVHTAGLTTVCCTLIMLFNTTLWAKEEHCDPVTQCHNVHLSPKCTVLARAGQSCDDYKLEYGRLGGGWHWEHRTAGICCMSTRPIVLAGCVTNNAMLPSVSSYPRNSD